MNIKASAALLLMTTALGGCALTTDKIDLQYTAQPSTQVAGASVITVEVRIVDQRQDKTKVSSKKNGFGMEMAPIVTNEDVTVTIQRALAQELAARGFVVRASAGSVLVSGDVIRFYNDHKTGFFSGDAIADLNMVVVVRGKDGRQVFTKTLVAQGVEPNTQLMSGNNARLALNRALSNGMRILFEDQAFIAALLGSPAPLASVSLQ